MNPTVKVLMLLGPTMALFYGATASAQEVIVVERGYAPDGPRFRGGISGGAGGDFASNYSYGLGGIDGRLGIQFNHIVAIYAQPHLAFGSGSNGSSSGFTTAFATTAMIDFTFFNRFFVGAGGGYGTLDRANGAVAQVRLGVYPYMRYAFDTPRRHGLMLGLDARTYFIDPGDVVQLMFSIGYEAF